MTNRRQFLKLLPFAAAAAPIAAAALGTVPKATAPIPAERMEFPQVHGAGQRGSHILTKGWKPGRVIEAYYYVSFSGVGAIGNPEMPARVPQLFVLVQRAVADDKGYAEIEIWPPITPAGIYQNVSMSPANGAMVVATFLPPGTITVPPVQYSCFIAS